MPTDRDFEQHGNTQGQTDKPSFSQAFDESDPWWYSIANAVVSEAWRNTLLEETGAPDFRTLGQWVVKAHENNWTASQMIEEMHKSLDKK